MVNLKIIFNINSDPSIKQYLLFKNKERTFIIKDLDETTLFVNSNHLEYINEKMNELHNENSYAKDKEKK